MARPKKVSGSKVIERGTPEMARLVEQGYGFSLEDAQRMLADWEKNPQSWSLEDVKKARAMLEAYKTNPIVTDPTPGWKRKKRLYQN